MTKPIGVREAARILGVHENTIRNWAKQGILPHGRMRHGSRAWLRFDEATVRAIGTDMPTVPLRHKDEVYKNGYNDGWRDCTKALIKAAAVLKPEE